MKSKLLIVFLLTSILGYSQTVVYSDNMEDTGWTWKGVPRILLNSYYTGGNTGTINTPINTNFFNSSDSCFALFGVGTGSSTIERDTLSYLNVTGLDPNGFYRFRFKVASFGMNPSVNTAAGVDGPDFVQIDYSSDGGITYFKEIRLTGSSNARWSFTGGISVGKVTSGALTIIAFGGTPITSLYIDLPVGTTQFTGNIILSCNATGETWMIDDVELVKVTALPIELVEFGGRYFNDGIKLYWTTATEINNDYFIIYKSYDGINYFEYSRIIGRGNSTTYVNYEIVDYHICDSLVYYKLVQVDYDGIKTEFDPIAFECRPGNPIDKRFTDILGRKVNQEFDGIRIYQK